MSFNKLFFILFVLFCISDISKATKCYDCVVDGCDKVNEDTKTKDCDRNCAAWLDGNNLVVIKKSDSLLMGSC